MGRSPTVAAVLLSGALGNLFVARYDARGGMSVIQVPRSLVARDPDRLIRIYQAFLPTDPVVCNLHHYPPQPCPPAAAPVAGAKA